MNFKGSGYSYSPLFSEVEALISVLLPQKSVAEKNKNKQKEKKDIVSKIFKSKNNKALILSKLTVKIY